MYRAPPSARKLTFLASGDRSASLTDTLSQIPSAFCYRWQRCSKPLATWSAVSALRAPAPAARPLLLDFSTRCNPLRRDDRQIYGHSIYGQWHPPTGRAVSTRIPRCKATDLTCLAACPLRGTLTGSPLASTMTRLPMRSILKPMLRRDRGFICIGSYVPGVVVSVLRPSHARSMWASACR